VNPWKLIFLKVVKEEEQRKRDLKDTLTRTIDMAPRRQNSDGPPKPRRKRRMPPPGTEEYKEKRDRNNVAVRKSREKTREKAKETVDRVSHLREENRMLEQQVEILSKELTILKDLFKMMHSDGKDPANSVDISVQTKSEVDGSTSPVMVVDPNLFELTETVAPTIIAPINIDVKSATEALKFDHQYMKTEN